MTSSSASAAAKASPQKYLFDAEFDYSETVLDIQSITPRQLESSKEKTRQQAYDAGYKKGVVETNETIQRIASDQLFVITGKIEEMIDAEEAVVNAFHGEVAQISELIMSALIPALAQQGARAEVQNLLDKARQSLPKDKVILLEVHDSLVSDITTFMTKGDAPQVTLNITAGEGFSLTDCRISWEGAGLEYYMGEVLQEIRTALLRIGGTPLSLEKPPPPTPPETSEDPEQIDQPEQEAKTE